MTRELDEILSGAIQDEPPATEPKVQTETPDEPQGQPRDETGKFASKDATDPEPSSDQPTADETDEQPKTSGTVPQKALHEARKKEQAERERADNLQRQLQEMRGQINLLAQQRNQPVQQEEPAAPNYWDAPENFTDYRVAQRVTPLEQELAETRQTLSRVNAVISYGKEAVSEAEEALKQAISSGVMPEQGVQQILQKSRDPVGEIVRWYQNTPQATEARLKEKIRAELEAEMLARQQAEQPAQRQPPVMPSNLAGARNVGTRTGPEWSGPQPLNDIFARRR